MPVEPAFERAYAEALRVFFHGDGEKSLVQAYELGRRAASDGMGILELAGLHHQLVARVANQNDDAFRRGGRFLLEALAPYEMTHRGFQETNSALRQLNDTLEQRVEQRTAEAEVARAEAERANRSKSDFLAVMSHELRTPLNAVLGYADLLDAGISGPLTEKQRAQVQAIRASGGHLLELIEEILTFAKIESGQEELTLEEVAAGAVVKEAAELVQPAALQRGIRFELDVPDRSGSLYTDLRKVRQILVNLLSNAIKFTEHGSVTLRVRLDDAWATFDVEDTGLGIEPENLDRIFESFWQVEQSRTRRTGGTGLGLSVTRTLARRLGGDVSVRSAVGQGSTFTVRLPRVSSDRQQKGDEEN